MKNGEIRPPKIVADPIYDRLIDIRPVLPIVSTPEFCALAYKYQLGMTYNVFPSATHTRIAHSYGSYFAAGELAHQWFRYGLISKDERKAMPVQGLLHDIGHGPFSHVTEDFYRDHDDIGLDIIRRLRPVIESCDVNYELVEKLFKHEHPLYLGVHDKNLGAEKFDYLERDGFYTILSRPPGILYLRDYLYFIDGNVAIDEKVVDDAKHVQHFYLTMYKNVYFRKSLIIAQRMFQKAIYHLLLAGEVRPEELQDLTDHELIGKMAVSAEPMTATLYKRVRERRFFKEAVVARPEGCKNETRIAGKAISVFEVSQAEVTKLVESPSLQKGNQANLERLENEIASIAGIPQGEVVIVPIFNPERFVAKDLWIYCSNDKKLYSLRERRPKHFTDMEETARSYFALRICASDEYRAVLSATATAERVLNLVLQR